MTPEARLAQRINDAIACCEAERRRREIELLATIAQQQSQIEGLKVALSLKAEEMEKRGRVE